MEASALTPGNSYMLLGTAHLTSLFQQQLPKPADTHPPRVMEAEWRRWRKGRRQ